MILLTWIRIRIDQTLWIRIRIQSIRIHITALIPYSIVLVGQYLNLLKCVSAPVGGRICAVSTYPKRSVHLNPSVNIYILLVKAVLVTSSP